MSVFEQLIAGALAGMLTVGTVGGCMELKAKIEEEFKKEVSIIEKYDDVIDGGDVDEFLLHVEHLKVGE